MIQQVKYTSPFIGWMYVYIYFGGFILRFDEADLKSLLFTYGSVLARLQ